MKGIVMTEPEPQELLKEINQLLINLDNADNERERDIYKKFIQLKIQYLSGLVKDL